jgi:hypothetical protein
MQTIRWSLSTGLLLSLAVLTADAATITVSYNVDDKALKAAPAGTVLTFELHADAACTSLLSSHAVNVENVDLIERLKLYAVKGAPKPPKTARMTHALTGATPGPTQFLEVTGTGVTPVGGACQPQLSSGPSSQELLVPASAFVPDGFTLADGDYFFTFGGSLSDGLATPSCLQAPVNLPVGASVTALHVDVNDATGGGLTFLNLYRVDLATGLTDLMGGAGPSANTGFQVLTDNTITTAVVDDSHAYYLGMCFDGSANAALFSARLTYTQ